MLEVIVFNNIFSRTFERFPRFTQVLLLKINFLYWFMQQLLITKSFVLNNQKIYKYLTSLNNCLKMLNIINPGYKKILELLSKETLHLREIAKKTNLNENSVYRFLNSLLNKNILTSKKIGNMKFFSLNKNKNTFLILTALAIEKQENLHHLRKTAIDTFLKNLPEQPVFTILFGSTAKGTYSSESDIDLLLITNKKINTQKPVYEANAQTGIKISVFQMNYLDFLNELKVKNEPVIQSAIKTGYPLTNHIKYYEETR